LGRDSDCRERSCDIVEQTPARKDRFPGSMIDAPENRVRIPTFKHWEINDGMED
jgi:hypothetical protein